MYGTYFECINPSFFGGGTSQFQIEYPPPLPQPVIPHFEGHERKTIGGKKNCYDLSIQNGGTKRPEVFQRVKN